MKLTAKFIALYAKDRAFTIGDPTHPCYGEWLALQDEAEALLRSPTSDPDAPYMTHAVIVDNRIAGPGERMLFESEDSGECLKFVPPAGIDGRVGIWQALLFPDGSVGVEQQLYQWEPTGFGGGRWAAIHWSGPAAERRTVQHIPPTDPRVREADPPGSLPMPKGYQDRQAHLYLGMDGDDDDIPF